MKIGIDIRPLQNGHKYRGIGEVTKQVTNYLLQKGAADGHEFVFYEFDDGGDPKDLLVIPGNLHYEVVKLGAIPENDKTATKMDKLKRSFAALYGQPIKQSQNVDVFLQYDFAAGVPTNTKTILVKHDLIPYVFWDKYFESAWVPFKNKAMRTTLRTLFANYKFMRQLRRGLKNAHVIVAVSHNTKRDVEKYFRVPARKVKVAHLGVDLTPAKTNDVNDDKSHMPTNPYLLFVGAGDARRPVGDLVAAYNNLRADGHDLQLVLVGENFKQPNDIPNVIVRNEVLKSSYKSDIITLGYVSDELKQTLFKNAIAYVYPTKYEGFGIPVLEAMLMNCPIIVYKNSSIPEVGGDHAIYVNDWEGIVTAVKNVMALPDDVRRSRLAAARKHAESFTWDKTAAVIYDELMEQGIGIK